MLLYPKCRQPKTGVALLVGSAGEIKEKALKKMLRKIILRYIFVFGIYTALNLSVEDTAAKKLAVVLTPLQLYSGGRRLL